MTDPATWRPTVGDVSAVLAQRTGDREGEARTNFASDTVPTADQVATIIAQVQSEVATRIGDMPTVLATELIDGDGPGSTPAGQVVAIGAAARVEIQFYPDLQGGDGPASQLRDWYRSSLDALVRAASDVRADSEVGADTVRPSWAFPDTVGAGLATTPWEAF